MVFGRWSTVNATANAYPPGPLLLSVAAGLILLCFSASTVLGESRGESYRPDDRTPKSRTEIRHEVRTRPDGVRIRISVRQETEGRGASSGGDDKREERQRQARPTPEPVAQPPAPTIEPLAALPEPRVEAIPAEEAPPEVTASISSPSDDSATADPQTVSAGPLFNPSVDDDTPEVAADDEQPAIEATDLEPVVADPQPTDAPVADVPVEAVPVAQAPPALFPTTPPFIELPPITVPTAANRAAIAPRLFVTDVLEELPLPAANVRMNPDLGLVAVPTWFWVEGYNGRAFGVSRQINIPAAIGDDVPVEDVPRDDPRRRSTSMSIAVTVRPSRYEWSFGDGSRIVTKTLGKPYPRASDVKHTYEVSSLRSPSGFTVGLTIEFAAEYRINGGAAQALPQIRRSYESNYRVQEIQPVLTSR
jgi:hypothetical protein